MAPRLRFGGSTPIGSSSAAQVRPAVAGRVATGLVCLGLALTTTGIAYSTPAVAARGPAGQAWNSQPAGALRVVAHLPFTDIVALACPSQTTCAAIAWVPHGYSSDALDIVATNDGWHTWATTKLLQVSQPAPLGAESISCANTKECLAGVTLLGEPIRGWALRGSSGLWAPVPMPEPTGISRPAAHAMGLGSSVTCAASGMCLLEAEYSAPAPRHLAWYLWRSQSLGRRWQRVSVPILFIRDLVCPSKSECLGSIRLTPSQDGPHRVSIPSLYQSVDAGLRWRVLPPVSARGILPRNFYLAYTVNGQGLACPDAQQCTETFVNGGAHPNGMAPTLMVTGFGTHVTMVSVPAALGHVACASRSWCVAWGQSASQSPVWVSNEPKSKWTRASLPLSGNYGVAAATCSPGRVCTAMLQGGKGPSDTLVVAQIAANSR